MSGLKTELQRKAFHMLSLCYLGAYKLIGYPAITAWLIGWAVVVAFIEIGRLYLPKLNDFLFSMLGALSRKEERAHASGILHTTLGVLVLVLVFGWDPRVVSAAVWCVAVGDAAAALVGKKFGTIKLVGPKSLEGSAACFASCLVICLAHGYPLPASVFAALAATAIELAPTTPWFNDNLWLPLGAAWALRALG